NRHQQIVEKLLTTTGIDFKTHYGDGLTILALASKYGHQQIVEKLLKTPGIDFNAKDENGWSAFALASQYGQVKIVEKLLETPGIDINAQDFQGQSPLSLAAEYGQEEIVDKLLANPEIDPNAKDKNGRTALYLAVLSNYEKIVEKLLTFPGIDINAKDKEGKTAISQASFNGREKIMEKLLATPEIDINTQDENGKSPLILASLKGFEKVVEKLLNKPGIDVNAKDKDGYSALSWSLLKGYEKVVEKLLRTPGIEEPTPLVKHFIEILSDLKSQDPRSKGSLTFVSVLPEVLLNTSFHPFPTFLRQIEHYFDETPASRNYYPNEAELLLLLKHPDLMEREPRKTESMTTCLTSISQFIKIGAKLSDQTLKTWGDIGFLTHAFRLWRYDTMGRSQSLFADFGFKPAPENRPLNQVFGKGFLYQEPSSGSFIEFRRGYLLVTHPEKGTLVIRNSSPAFGRDLLKHPAYYLKQALSPSEVLTFDPRTLSDLDSVLHRQHYPNKNNPSNSSALVISALTDTLLDLHSSYQKFKLDTQAFDNGNFTGHRSPGLPKLVQALNRFKSQNMPLPDLAFTQPAFPPYQPYYYHDADMKKTDRFKLTPSHLQELNDFVSGGWSPEKYPESDWIRFLNQAGVENRAELVLLEPEKNKP
ncbi:MAG: ankyrin repeat domain-containing protein, partial [Cyanobacteria bacterium]|nr:ankyrin repeat domain-containing protein [Cyanobacteriota bacterium]